MPGRIKTPANAKLAKYAFESGDTQAESGAQSATQTEPTLKDLMIAIQSIKSTLETKMDAMAIDLTLLRTDLGKTRDKANEVEKQVQEVTKEAVSSKQRIARLEQVTFTMAKKLEDLEGRSRRNNLRITGVPEKEEGRDVEAFVEKLINQGLQPRNLSEFFTIERAHRIPGRPPQPGGPPRTIIAKLLHYRDRDTILQAARVAPAVKINNAIIRFFPDFTMQVQQARREFLEVKAALRNEGLKYAMLFPAKLRVEAQGRTQFFYKPAEAWDWLERVQQQGAEKGGDIQRQNPVDRGAKTKVQRNKEPSKPSPERKATNPPVNPDTRKDWFEAE